MNVAVSALISAGGALVATPLAARVATRLGVVDRPGPTKVHSRPVPYLGGLGVAVGLALPIAWARPAALVPAAFALGLGFIDDLHDLYPTLRLTAEAGIGAVTAWLFPTSLPEPFGFLAVVVVVVVLINAVNLIDGLDGLASSVVAVSAIGFAIVLDGPERIVAVAVAGALAGFLVFNRPPARIFLGDSGAYMLGCLLAVLLASSWAPDRPTATGVSALLLVGVPVADVSVAVLRRALGRRPLLVSDRGHIYDQLVSRSWTPQRATIALAGAQAVLAVLAVAASRMDLWLAVLIVVSSVLGVVAVVMCSGFLTFHRPSGAS